MNKALLFASLVATGLILFAQDAPSICRHHTRGASRPIDLDRLAENYARIPAAIKFQIPQPVDLPIPDKPALPACMFPANKEMQVAMPKSLVGSTLYFVTREELRTLRPGPRCAAFVLDYEPTSQASCDLGVYPAPAQLLKMLGVTCHPARVTVKGERNVLLETLAR